MSEDYGDLPLEDFTHQLLLHVKIASYGIWAIAGLLVGIIVL